jgi:hypothetical protein
MQLIITYILNLAALISLRALVSYQALAVYGGLLVFAGCLLSCSASPVFISHFVNKIPNPLKPIRSKRDSSCA